jgi:hypothetical protein
MQPSLKCRMCGRSLTARTSVIAGIGPDCSTKSAARAKASQASEHGNLFLHEPGRDVVLRLVNGRPGTNVVQREVYHSPGGFAWGYEGSGPADLAYNVLLNYLPPPIAYHWHQDFKRDHVARVPEAGGVIKHEAIVSWIAEQATKNPPPRSATAPRSRCGETRKYITTNRRMARGQLGLF